MLGESGMCKILEKDAWVDWDGRELCVVTPGLNLKRKTFRHAEQYCSFKMSCPTVHTYCLYLQKRGLYGYRTIYIWLLFKSQFLFSSR